MGRAVMKIDDCDARKRLSSSELPHDPLTKSFVAYRSPAGTLPNQRCERRCRSRRRNQDVFEKAALDWPADRGRVR